jgi:uncharacterized protein with HEPN domain
MLTQASEKDFDAFVRDPSLKRAFVRSIEIIGEASKKIPKDVQDKQPNIEWRKMMGMRDRLIHDYFGVDYAIVWDVAVNKLPELREKIESMLQTITKTES